MTRSAIYARDHHRCVYCGLEATAAELTLDHVEPRMRGGDQSEGNLVTCCRACNTLKKSEAAWSFLSKNTEMREHFLRAVGDADVSHAPPVWPRLVRAVRETAEKRKR